MMNITQRVTDTMYKFLGLTGVESGTQITQYDNSIDVNNWLSILEGRPYWLGGKMRSAEYGSAAIRLLVSKMTLEFESEVVPTKKSSKRAVMINKGYKHLVKNTGSYLESMIALGGGVFKVFLSSSGKVGVDFYNSTRFVPVRFDEYDELQEVIFIDRERVKGVLYTKLEHHNFDESAKVYSVKTTIHKGVGIANGKLDSKPLKDNEVPISGWKSIKDYTIKGKDFYKPHFVYMKTPYSNSTNINSKLGVSIFSTAETFLEAIDKNFNYLDEHMGATQTTTYMPLTFMSKYEIDENGNERPIERPDNDRVYAIVNETGNPDNDKIQVESPTIQGDKYLSVIDEHLRSIERHFGLAHGELSKSTDVSKTATEIAASKERSFVTVITYQKLIREIYTELVDLMNNKVDVFSTMVPGLPEDDMGNYTINIYFDDSIAADSKRSRILFEEYQAGLISREFYLRYGRGLSDIEIEEATNGLSEAEEKTVEDEE